MSSSYAAQDNRSAGLGDEWEKTHLSWKTDNDLNRSLAKTGSSKIETPRDSLECEIATIGTACPTEIGKPVAMADVAESSGPPGTGAGGPVVAGTQFPAVADRTRASGPRGSETGSPVVTGTRFRPDTEVAEASGPAGAGGSVVTGMRFRKLMMSPEPVARPQPVPVARSEPERDSGQLVGLPEPVARLEPEPVARS